MRRWLSWAVPLAVRESGPAGVTGGVVWRKLAGKGPRPMLGDWPVASAAAPEAEFIKLFASCV